MYFTRTSHNCIFIVLPDLIKVVRCILQGRLQTYIHSLTRYNKSSQMYFTRTSHNCIFIVSQDLIKVVRCI
jgi:hypothetical protein